MFVGGESENQVAQIMSSLTHAIWLIAKLKIKSTNKDWKISLNIDSIVA